VAIRGRRAERSKAAAAWLNSNAPQAPQFFFSTSLCTVLPISIKRRHTFSRNEITLSTSASLGSLSSGSPGFASDGLGAPGTGSPGAKGSSSASRSPPAGGRSRSPAPSARRVLPCRPSRHRSGCTVRPGRCVGHRIEAVAAVLAIGRRLLCKAHLMGPCNHGEPQWSTMSD